MPSKAAAAFLIAIGLTFAGIGFLVAGAFLAAGPANVHGSPMAVAFLCGVFVLIGGGIVYATIYGNRKLKEQAAAQQSAPDSPWLWQKDWAASRADSKDLSNATGLWLLAGVLTFISLTLTALTAHAPLRNSG